MTIGLDIWCLPPNRMWRGCFWNQNTAALLLFITCLVWVLPGKLIPETILSDLTSWALVLQPNSGTDTPEMCLADMTDVNKKNFFLWFVLGFSVLLLVSFKWLLWLNVPAYLIFLSLLFSEGLVILKLCAVNISTIVSSAAVNRKHRRGKVKIFRLK